MFKKRVGCLKSRVFKHQQVYFPRYTLPVSGNLGFVSQVCALRTILKHSTLHRGVLKHGMVAHASAQAQVHNMDMRYIHNQIILHFLA